MTRQSTRSKYIYDFIFDNLIWFCSLILVTSEVINENDSNPLAQQLQQSIMAHFISQVPQTSKRLPRKSINKNGVCLTDAGLYEELLEEKNDNIKSHQTKMKNQAIREENKKLALVIIKHLILFIWIEKIFL